MMLGRLILIVVLIVIIAWLIGGLMRARPRRR